MSRGYAYTSAGLNDPAPDVSPVTFSDAADLPVPARGLLLGAAADVRVLTLRGRDVTLPLPAGYNPIMVRRVFATGTTAAAGSVFALHD